MSMNPTIIRKNSEKAAKRLGYDILPSLPLVEPSKLRSLEMAATRSLCLNVVLAASWGFPRERGIRWATDEGLMPGFTDAEAKFLKDGLGGEQFQIRDEAQWVLAWALKLVDQLDFGKTCGDHLVTLFPNLKINESSIGFRNRVNLRPSEEIDAARDLAYCLHWAIRQSAIDGREMPNQVTPYVVVERRRALEWLCGEDDWDNMAMDT